MLTIPLEVLVVPIATMVEMGLGDAMVHTASEITTVSVDAVGETIVMIAPIVEQAKHSPGSGG